MNEGRDPGEEKEMPAVHPKCLVEQVPWISNGVQTQGRARAAPATAHLTRSVATAWPTTQVIKAPRS